MSIEIRHLRAIAAIADKGSITAAAQTLSTSQPNLSRTLLQLEDAVGTALVERTTRRLRLTTKGGRLLDVAKRLLRDLDAALAEIADI